MRIDPVEFGLEPFLSHHWADILRLPIYFYCCLPPGWFFDLRIQTCFRSTLHHCVFLHLDVYAKHLQHAKPFHIIVTLFLLKQHPQQKWACTKLIQILVWPHMATWMHQYDEYLWHNKKHLCRIQLRKRTKRVLRPSPCASGGKLLGSWWDITIDGQKIRDYPKHTVYHLYELYIIIVCYSDTLFN